MKKIVTYNVNGIRAASSKGLLDWITSVDADIVCFQETKAQPEQIPTMEFNALGYHSYWFSAKKKGYSGVGIITRQEPDKVVYGMGIPKYDDEGRVLRADYGDISVISVYHPSGSSGDDRQAFKMVWLDDFLNWVNELKKSRPNLIICGDYNICHKPIDIHDPIRNATSSGFLPEEREWMSKFIDSGFVDGFRAFNNEPKQYTWWSFRANARAKNLGWRIDYHMVSNPISHLMKRAVILPEAKHSDHCPSILEVDF
ncbi:MAG TPA: exodeoxyribonuclease III [Bacteroidales bacterium]|nr:exodeoxyribonuclease III [Bacteroidales bacterium]HQI69706.1 exodeoxyribonuclease III [Bacteroidales bacterium]